MTVKTVELAAIVEDVDLVENTARDVTVEIANGPFIFMVIVV